MHEGFHQAGLQGSERLLQVGTMNPTAEIARRTARREVFRHQASRPPRTPHKSDEAMSESKDMLVSDERFVSITAKVTCEICDGGKIMGSACAVCEGTGKRDPDMYEVRDRLRPLFMDVRAELSRLRAERDEAMHLLRAAKDGQIENNGLWHTMIHVEEFLSKHSKEGLPDKK